MKRRGITLTEALVALFIAALGMISLLTLFPLGALTTGQALRDARTTNSAAEADGLLRWYWSKYQPAGNAGPLQLAFDRAEYPALTTGTHPMWISTGPNPNGSSYPVLIDPIGCGMGNPYGLPTTTWSSPTMARRVADYPTFPRQTLYEFAPGGSATSPNYQPMLVRKMTDSPPPPLTLVGSHSKSKILRFTMLQDDLTYSEQQTGAPRPQANATDPNVERGGRYTWAWLLQKPNATRPTIDVKIIVFDQRAPFYANAETEQAYNVGGLDSRGVEMAFFPGSTRLTIPYGLGPRPPITRGRWIMDATIGHQNSFTGITPGPDMAVHSGYTQPPPTNTTPPFGNPPQVHMRHANFYRVVSVNDETPGYLDVELETPIRRNDGLTGPGSAYQGTVIVLNGVAEVFERPPLNPAP